MDDELFSDDEAPTYSLVMPFVVCQSKDGPYDDGAFVAGVRFGKLDSLLNMKPSQHSEYVEAELVPQLELLAMHHGYKFEAQPWEDHPTEWVLVTFGGE